MGKAHGQMTTNYYIYGLFDPTILKYFYVGVATNLKQRKRAHLYTFRTRHHLFVLLHSMTDNGKLAYLVEQAYILAARDAGHPLVNIKAVRGSDPFISAVAKVVADSPHFMPLAAKRKNPGRKPAVRPTPNRPTPAL